MPPFTHLDALKTLSPSDKSALLQKSDAKGLRHLALHLGALLLTGTYIALKLPFWPALLPIQGILLVFLFTLQHECTHQTPFATPILNEIIGHATGIILLQPFLWFRYFHLAHHRHTNDPAHDPELAGTGKPATWPAYLWHLSGITIWYYLIKTLLTNAFGHPSAPYIPPRTLPRLRTESRLMLATYTLALLSLTLSPQLLWLWIIPILLGQPFLRLYLLAEHGHCPPVTNMLENSRTTFTNRAIRALAWNMPYHIEHHSAPMVPFHHLPALHNALKPHLITTADGYTNFTRAYIDTLKPD